MSTESITQDDRMSGDARPADIMPTQHIVDEITGLASRISIATARMLYLIGEFDRREGWAGFGVKSCAHWLSWQCHIGRHAAREQVRVARALQQLPLVAADFATGRLSYSKVRAITRVATRDCEADLVELARNATAQQVERTVASWRRTDSLSTDDRANRQFFRWHHDDGMLVFSGRLDTDEGAEFLATLEAMQTSLAEQLKRDREHLPHRNTDPNDDENRDGCAGDDCAGHDADQPLPNLADGLIAMARSALTGDGTTEPQTLLVVELDAAVLHDDATAAKAAYATGGRISHAHARRLACDTHLVTLLREGKDVLDVGRKTRTVNRALRLALQARDGGCAMPGCTERRHRKLHAHHIVHWADGGPTCLDNLVLLCRYHHRLVHEDDYDVSFRSGALKFRAPDRSLLEPVPQRRGATEPLQPLIESQRANSATRWQGEPLRLDYVLSTLMARRELRRRKRQGAEHPGSAAEAGEAGEAGEASPR